MRSWVFGTGAGLFHFPRSLCVKGTTTPRSMMDCRLVVFYGTAAGKSVQQRLH